MRRGWLWLAAVTLPAVTGLLAWWYRRRTVLSLPGQEESIVAKVYQWTEELMSGTEETEVEGVRAKKGVVFTPQILTGLQRLRDALGQDAYGLVVTDGWRTPEVQAARLWSKYLKGTTIRGKYTPPGFGALYALYKADWIIAKLEEAGASKSAWASVLKKLANQGYYLSDHQRGDAFDLRTRGMPADDRAKILAAVKALGGSALDEGDHIHVENLG
jgi:hypothetical protein